MQSISEKDIVRFFYGTADKKSAERTESWLKENFGHEGFEQISKEFWNLSDSQGDEAEYSKALHDFYARVNNHDLQGCVNRHDLQDCVNRHDLHDHGNKQDLQGRVEEKRGRVHRPSFGWLKYAAAVAVVAATAFLTYKISYRPELKWQELYTANDRIDSLVFSDGSKIWINGGSRVVYPESFSGKNREIFISGEAYLDVTHDEKRPFVVKAGPVDVNVLGTRFNVRTSDSFSKASVDLYEGHVVMHTENGADVCLNAGEGCGYDVKKDKIEKYVLGGEEKSLWLQGGFELEYQKLEDIVVALSQKYNKKIVVTDDELAERKFRISVVEATPLYDLLEAIDFNDEMECVEFGDVVLISKRD